MNVASPQPRGNVFVVDHQAQGDASYVVLGAFGDLCIILPLFYNESRRRGKPVNVVVGKRYSSILEGVSYVNPIIWEGDYKDINQVVVFAKKECGANVKFINPVLVPLQGSVAAPMPHKTPSFETEMYELAGRREDWGKFPLVFDRRDPVREKKLVESVSKDDRPMILVAPVSYSVPFPTREKPDRDALLMLLVKEFPECNIVDLSNIKCDRLYDFLGLFDAAKALISVDTAHLHLSLASKVPLFAFVADSPELWRGSPFHPRMTFHCRYSDYEPRKSEFVHQLRNVLNGVKQPIIRTIDQINLGSYNPSIIDNGDGYLMTYRWHPANKQESRPFMAELDSNFKVVFHCQIGLPPQLRGLAVEDARLFRFKGLLYISYTVARFPMPPFVCRVGYGRIEKVNGGWYLVEDIQPKYSTNDMTAMQKNWIAMPMGDKLYFIYGGNPQMVVEVVDDKVVAEYNSPIPDVWKYGQLHAGTTPIPWKGKLLRFFHSRSNYSQKPYWWCYRVGVCIMEPEPPFAILRVNPEAVIVGDEEHRISPYFKNRVAFPGGAVMRGDKVYLAMGHNDSACRIAEFEESNLGL